MSWSSPKLKKSNFLKKNLFSRYRTVVFKISHICCIQSTIKNCELKDQEWWNIYFIKTMLKRMERFICKWCSKVPINTQGKFVTLALSYQYGQKNDLAYFHFEQLSIFPLVSLLLTFNKFTALGVLSFSIHHFYVSQYNQCEWTQVYIRTFEKKQTKNERWKEKP